MAIPGRIFLAQYGVSVAVGANVAVGACVAVGGGAVVAVGSRAEVATTCATSSPPSSPEPQLTNTSETPTPTIDSRYVRGIVSRLLNNVKLAYISRSKHEGATVNVNDTIL